MGNRFLRVWRGGNIIGIHGGHGLVFHGAVSAHAGYGLSVFLQGVGPEDLRKVIHHIRDAGKGGQSCVVLAGEDETLNWNGSRHLVDLHVSGAIDADEIGGHGILADPMGGRSAVAIVRDPGPDAVAGGFPIAADGYMQVYDGFVPGIIVTGPPIPGGVGIGQSVDVGRGEKHPDVVTVVGHLRRPGIKDLRGKGLSRGDVEADVDDPAGMGVSRCGAVDQHAGDREANKVVLQQGERVFRQHSGQDVAIDEMGLVVEGQREFVALDIKAGQGISPAFVSSVESIGERLFRQVGQGGKPPAEAKCQTGRKDRLLVHKLTSRNFIVT